MQRAALVVVPPQINKYYITDLAPGRSLVESTVAAGIPYFTMSWRNPTPEQRDWDLDTYAAACLEAIRVACDIAGTDDANVVGLCAGGVTLAALLGHLAATGESGLVNSATFLVAGLDTTHRDHGDAPWRPGEPSRRRGRGRCGRVSSSGDDMARVFAWLRPNDLVWNYWVNNYLLGENPPAFDILFWNNDTTRLPAGLHSDFLDLYLTNGLVEGTLEVLGTPVDLGKVELRQLRRRRLHRPHHPVGRRVPHDAAPRRRQPVRAQQRRSHPGHPQPAGQPEGVVPHVRLAAGDGGRVARGRHPGDAGRGGRCWHEWLARALRSHPGARRRTGNAGHRPLDAAPGRYVHL